MSGVVSAVAALLSFVSLVLVAISMATNSWVRFAHPRAPPDAAAAINPTVTNPKLVGLTLTYDVENFGLWVGCHREAQFNKLSCAFIGSSCYSDVCWTRNGREKVCLDAQVTAVARRCAAFRATRAFMIIGTLLLILGAAVLLVSVCVTARNLVLFGAVLAAVGAFALMVAFAVFYSDVFRKGRLYLVGVLGYSFVLLVVSWPLAVVAAVVALLGAFLTPSKEYDYADSE